MFSKEVVEIVKNLNLKRFGRVCDSKKYKEIFEKIKSETGFLNDLNPTITQRIWHIENNNSSVILCKNCNNKVKWKKGSYAMFCSTKCVANDVEIKTKREKTNVEKYGVKNPFQSEKIKNDIKTKVISQYNVENVSQINYADGVLEKLSDRQWLYEEHIVNKKTLVEIGKMLGVNYTTIGEYLKKHNIQQKYFSSSIEEKELFEFISEKFYVIRNTRNVISPKEIDLYIPEKKVAIEYCGLYWHTFDKKGAMYHYDKYVACKQKGIRLLTIYSDEWKNKKDLIKIKLDHILGTSVQKRVYARKCNIKIIDKKTTKKFIDENHIQGNCYGSINLGLFHENELVSVMCFKRRRNLSFELIRFCTSCVVVGGFQKLLSYFKENNTWEEIITFADLRWHEGDVYNKSGFTQTGVLKPDYQYVYSNIRSHKFNFRKERIKVKFPNYYDKEKTESELMEEIGIPKIYDCGKLRFSVKNSLLFPSNII